MKDTDQFDLDLTRDYSVSLDRLWQVITAPDQLIQWFGPEGVDLADCRLDFTRTGPWYCVMVGKESGNRFHVSGEVTSVRPPDGGAGSVGLTWGWHDPDGRRGHESHVMFTVSAIEGGARLLLSHRSLESITSSQDHNRGWLSTLRSLDAYLGA